MSNSGSNVVDAEIHGRLEVVSGLFARKASADEIVTYMCWPEVVIASDASPIRHGIDELLPSAREFVAGMGHDVVFEVIGSIVSSDQSASCLAYVKCLHEGQETSVSTALYVWERRDDDWKVIREMVCSAPDA